MNNIPYPALIPRPLHIQRLPGFFEITPETRIVADPELWDPAELLAERLRQSTGWPILVTSSADDPPPGNTIDVRRTPASAGAEAYSIRATEEKALISAEGAAGAWYGAQTLLQLLPPAIFCSSPRVMDNWRLPCVTIEDTPRFRWRGVMLDSVRHFQPVEYLRKFIDLLSQHKINVLHWHLTDDQGWRIEIKKYPRLSDIGGQRRETPLGHYESKRGGDGIPYGGAYSQEDIKALIAYAARRNVSILPEIEMPGHARAAVAAYPQLGVLPEPVEVSCEWGVHETLFNIKPATLDFLKEVLEEVIALFPFEYIHVGGDEAVKTQWKEDPDTQGRMKQMGLKDEHELQSWFIRQMAEFLKSRGRKLVGWDEILEGGLAPGSTVMSWRGTAGAIAAANLGHPAVMCSNTALYFDYCQSDSPASEPLSIGGKITLEMVYHYEPVPEELPAELRGSILGVQGQLWTEYMPSIGRVEYMAFPRVAALAEVAWSGKERPPFSNFTERLKTHLKRLDCQDVRYRAPLE